jgi:hypothetical protein
MSASQRRRTSKLTGTQEGPAEVYRTDVEPALAANAQVHMDMDGLPARRGPTLEVAS